MTKNIKFMMLKLLIITSVALFAAGDTTRRSLLDFIPKDNGEYNIKTGSDVMIGIVLKKLGNIKLERVGTAKVIKLDKHNFRLAGKLFLPSPVSIKGDYSLGLSSNDGKNWKLTIKANLVETSIIPFSDDKDIPVNFPPLLPVTTSESGEKLSFNIPYLERYGVGKINMYCKEKSKQSGAKIYFENDLAIVYLYNR